MLRRIAFTLASVAAAGLVAAAPAVASDWEGGKTVAGYQHVEGHKASAEYLNLGGPYGITYGKAKKAHFEAERGYFYNQYLHGR
ncbi:hypothetical protein OG473_06745 [Streptomyces anulatus]|uniref:Uncharacterized protein n=1 Tax=Streptomyces anulatus TaxID=1892 RepID=A0ABZ1ZDY6_STRAQ|nr:hypothetical protein [Streptomyces anulatus]WST89078.1 hypothetical protein OG238_33930 [Streptomyces anulatus]WSU32665.1 hypothetical protein OG391_31585 [Streptomyces anulatus]WSU88485.1 hypothetical protein OG575_07350 [Streptomyces anulatus]